MNVSKQTLSYRKGIILAGGKGSRLFPLTQIISKQLLPVYNKPMIFYCLSVLMLANIRDILIISDPVNLQILIKFLGKGKDLGINISYALQKEPNGIAEAFLIGEKFINNSPVALILGDNIFFGHKFGEELEKISSSQHSSIFLYRVPDPKRFGVAQVSSNGKVIHIEEKPKKPRSNYAITGLYFYDEDVVYLAKQLKYSKRGELEITDLNNLYLKEKKLFAHFLTRGFSWYDTGTFDSLNDASNIVRLTEQRQGIRIGYPYEIALRKKWISINDLHIFKNKFISDDIEYLRSII